MEVEAKQEQLSRTQTMESALNMQMSWLPFLGLFTIQGGAVSPKFLTLPSRPDHGAHPSLPQDFNSTHFG